ncbi:type 1 glutamine amidotransferase [Halorhabdus salina]|uniref:type 1 glutamine amidotransferase n=1 Tax=Halorhabdus salina TaxID=2750670 RepID=UPI0015EF1749|nr:type 1 glutamine amidotransferase [Halorhabdus salina]
MSPDRNGEPTITLLDASIGETPAQRNVRRELDLPQTAHKVSEGHLPPDPTGEDWDADGVVISGSQTAVYDDRAWIKRTAEWVEDAVIAGVPVLGICWGHQLLARALGGRVGPMDDYELGYATVERVAPDPLLEGAGKRFLAFESHSDAVTDLPTDARVLADNDQAIQAFRLRNALGVQFHPEYDVETARWVVQNKADELPDDRLDAIQQSITPQHHAKTAGANAVFDAFERLVRERS